MGGRAAERRHRGRADGHPRGDPHARRRAGRPGGRALAVGAVPGARARARHAGLGVLGRGDGARGRGRLLRPALSADEHGGRRGGRLRPRRRRRPASSAPSPAPREAHLPSGRRRAARSCRSTSCAGPRSRRSSSTGRARSTGSTTGAGRYAVLNHVLGGGLSSRLFQKVREERGLAYSVWSERIAYADSGSLAVVVGTAPENVDEVLRIVDAELELLATRRRDRPRARRGQGEPARRDAPLGRGLGRAHEPVRARRCCCTAKCCASTRCWPASMRSIGTRCSTRPRCCAGSPRSLSAVGPFDEDDLARHVPAMAAR